MSDSILNFVQQKLEEVGRSGWPAIHDATGVPLSTIEKIAYGVHEDPRISTIEPLYAHFQHREPA